jgi:hypothetical protein
LDKEIKAKKEVVDLPISPELKLKYAEEYRVLLKAHEDH